MSYKKTLIVIFILAVAFITRFYKLGSEPNGVYVDEASIGYNAYSILKTGRDEFGKEFPIVFRSFNDFKTPIYIYLSVPFVKLFGLTSFSIRFLSAVASFLTVPLVYLLVKEIFKFSRVKNKIYPDIIPLVTMLLLALSPWHVLFGRAAFETNLALFFFVIATYLIYKSFTKPKFLILAALFFALTILTYHSQRVITPLFLLAFFIRHKKTFLSKTHKVAVIFSILVGLMVLIPSLAIITTPGFVTRASGLNIFNYSTRPPGGFVENAKGILGGIANLPIFLSTREFIFLYFSYFSPRNLFFLGDPDPRASYPGLSTFYLWQFPFYIFGVYRLMTHKMSEFGFFTLITLVLSPLAAAFTRDPFTTIRSLPLVIPLVILVSVGIIETLVYIYTNLARSLHKNKFDYFAATLVFFTVIYSLTKLYSSGVILNNYYRAKDWNYGFGQLSNTLNSLKPDVPIIFDNVRVEPYSELLFFLNSDPQTYQKTNFEVYLNEYYTNLNRNKHKIIGEIETRAINWEEDSKTEKYLIGDSLAISPDQIVNNKLSLISKILYPDGSLAFIVVKTNP